MVSFDGKPNLERFIKLFIQLEAEQYGCTVSERSK